MHQLGDTSMKDLLRYLSVLEAEKLAERVETIWS